MNIFEKHEIFEIEVLGKLQSDRLLESVVFGGGTMLRLCHEMKRYSVDLDFWRIKAIPETVLFKRFKNVLKQDYEITDAKIKHYTLLFEIRSRHFPKRLKIEIRKEIRDWDAQEKIAYSKFSTKQILLKAHTLPQTMVNKIAALLERGEIRDAFDIEFLLRMGVKLPKLSNEEIAKLKRRLNGFKTRDFKVKLGSVLESDLRAYYVENRFSFFKQQLDVPLITARQIMSPGGQ